MRRLEVSKANTLKRAKTPKTTVARKKGKLTEGSSDVADVNLIGRAVVSDSLDAATPRVDATIALTPVTAVDEDVVPNLPPILDEELDLSYFDVGVDSRAEDDAQVPNPMAEVSIHSGESGAKASSVHTSSVFFPIFVMWSDCFGFPGGDAQDAGWRSEVEVMAAAARAAADAGKVVTSTAIDGPSTIVFQCQMVSL